MNNIDEKYASWEAGLWKKYDAIFSDAKSTITDGIVFPSDYFQSPLKVMILNKEPYDKENDSYPVNKAIKDGIKEGKRIFADQRTMRTHLKQYFSVLDLLMKGDIRQVTVEQAQENKEAFCDGEEKFNEFFKHVGYCNIKKSDGKPRSYTMDLLQYAFRGREIIKEQIRYFAPSIILGGGLVADDLEKMEIFEFGDILYESCSEGERSVRIFQLKENGKEYPFVEMYHPARARKILEEGRLIPMREYYLELLKGLQAIEKKQPGFWIKHMNKPCFE